jgi:hypothetical protein
MVVANAAFQRHVIARRPSLELALAGLPIKELIVPIKTGWSRVCA